MRSIDDTTMQALFGAPLSAPIFESHACTYSTPVRPADHLTQPVDTDLAVELARTFPGEGTPADTGCRAPAKASRSTGLPFELAAVFCQHDPTSATGAAAARRDWRVWDLVNDGAIQDGATRMNVITGGGRA